MWEAVEAVARQAECALTVYVDDVTISGHQVPERVVWQIKQQIHRCGLRYHKEKRYMGPFREVTGVIIRNGKLMIPNRRHLTLHTLRQQMQKERDLDRNEEIKRKLHGCEAQARQIADSNLV